MPQVEFPWEHPELEDFPAGIRTRLEHVPENELQSVVEELRVDLSPPPGDS